MVCVIFLLIDDSRPACPYSIENPTKKKVDNNQTEEGSGSRISRPKTTRLFCENHQTLAVPAPVCIGSAWRGRYLLCIVVCSIGIARARARHLQSLASEEREPFDARLLISRMN